MTQPRSQGAVPGDQTPGKTRAGAADRGSSRPRLGAVPDELFATLDLLPDAVLLIGSRTHRVEYANPAAEQVFGRSAEQLVGRGADQLDCPSGQERRDGESRQRAGEQLFRLAFEQAPTGMALIRVAPDGARVILRANAALAELFGEPDPARLAGRDFAEFTDPADEAGDRRLARLVAVGAGSPEQRPTRFRRADGSSVWVEINASVIDVADPAGVLTLSHLVDVTRQHEAQLRRLREATLAQLLARLTASLLAGVGRERIYADLTAAAAELTAAADAWLCVPGPDGEPVRVAAFGPSPPQPGQLGVRADAGPVAAVPIALGNGREGHLGVGRPREAEPFSALERELLDRLASQAGLVIQLAHARRDQERLTLLEDRHRIARDLHDTVIQDLIAVGMQLNPRESGADDLDWQWRRAELLQQVETAVGRLRGAVFALRREPSTRSFLETVDAICRNAGRVLGHQPAVSVRGRLSDLSEPVAIEITAVLREALSNVARHAAARHTEVSVGVEAGLVRLTVADDGLGLPVELVPGDGLANIQDRAHALGGWARICTRESGGARLEWCCPQQRRDPRAG